jgi:multicomponent Na+:H+ antiporter subunit G
MTDILGSALIVLGTLLIVLAAFGLLRMPDIYLRLSATSKSSSLGIACVLAGVALLMLDTGVTLRALIIVAFVFLTVPVASHILGRAAYRAGTGLWAGSVVDEMGEELHAGTSSGSQGKVRPRKR